MPERAGALAGPQRAMRMGGILDDNQIVPLGNGHDGVHVGHLRGDMHGDDGPRPLGDDRFNGFRVDAEGVRIDIDQHRNRAGHHGRGGGRLEGVGGNQDFIAPADAGRAQGDLHGDGAVHDRDSVAAALHLDKCVKKALRLRPRIREAAPVAAAHDFGDRFDIALVVRGPARISCASDRAAAEKRQFAHASSSRKTAGRLRLLSQAELTIGMVAQCSRAQGLATRIMSRPAWRK